MTPSYHPRDSDGTIVIHGSAPDIGALEFLHSDDAVTPAAPGGLRLK